MRGQKKCILMLLLSAMFAGAVFAALVLAVLASVLLYRERKTDK